MAAVVLVCLAAGGCSGSDDQPDADGPTPTASSSAATPEVVTDVSIGKLAGKLPTARRAALADDVQQVVDGWIDAAYLAGDYPRTDFSDSWPGFTAGARATASRDGDLMSNRDIGASIDAVEPEKRQVVLDVLSVRKKPVGVTAHVVVRFATSGDTTKDVRVAGRLYLTKGTHGWQVFGYDVTKDAR
ncbi:hypothetical protein ASC77_06340 [Nocardioides sp. Root1257]|uniref:hypothetical protein n=1 Tax=unclassified Nocardioides TaxID=2615069 RepID=UPI0006FA2344|nr:MULTISPECIES: hypothetical protein [unclassified Nocardioides]KQW48377.1 hypothetical protein ASC77_06340 [Nocardioides sp. Root1257]KRC47551.1 hypothetical protein ASE24_06340 [Nocardioides sp. Root224]